MHGYGGLVFEGDCVEVFINRDHILVHENFLLILFDFLFLLLFVYSVSYFQKIVLQDVVSCFSAVSSFILNTHSSYPCYT